MWSGLWRTEDRPSIVHWQHVISNTNVHKLQCLLTVKHPQDVCYRCKTFTMTSTFTARGVTFRTHKAGKKQNILRPSLKIQNIKAHAPVWPHMHIFEHTKRHTPTPESKGLTFANGINPNKETSCFLEHNTAKLLCGAQAVNTRKSQNQFIVHRCTCVSVQRLSVSGNAAGCAFKCRCTIIIFVGCRGERCVRERVRVSKRRRGGRESRW